MGLLPAGKITREEDGSSVSRVGAAASSTFAMTSESCCRRRMRREGRCVCVGWVDGGAGIELYPFDNSIGEFISVVKILHFIFPPPQVAIVEIC